MNRMENTIPENTIPGGGMSQTVEDGSEAFFEVRSVEFMEPVAGRELKTGK